MLKPASLFFDLGRLTIHVFFFFVRYKRESSARWDIASNVHSLPWLDLILRSSLIVDLPLSCLFV